MGRPVSTSEECPRADDYGRCVCCGHRYRVSCTCGMSFADKAKTVGIDHEQLRKFHGI